MAGKPSYPYSRASLDINGNPWDKHRQLIKWNGKNWNWLDVADYGTQPPGSDAGPFIMLQKCWPSIRCR